MGLAVRKNTNRGNMQLRVWQDAVEYHRLTYPVFRALQYGLNRVIAQQIGSVDSIHRNIAEGYCRRSVREYLQFLNCAMASVGESVSGLHTYRRAGQIPEEAFVQMDALAYKIENGMKRLTESLARKRDESSWQDSYVVEESNAAYGEPGPG